MKNDVLRVSWHSWRSLPGGQMFGVSAVRPRLFVVDSTEARKGTVYFSPFDLQTDLDGAQVYSSERVKDFVSRYLAGEDREELDPILEACVEVCLQDLDEDGQVQFKR